MASTPKVVFIIPYRDREEQKKNFIEKMSNLLEHIDKTHIKFFLLINVTQEISIEGL